MEGNYWQEPTAHQTNWERYNCAYVYQYDPTDDGPEAETVKAINATHTPLELATERWDTIQRVNGWKTWEAQ